MPRLVLTLTGLALLSQLPPAIAQTGAVKNNGLDQFFSAVLRSSPSPSPKALPDHVLQNVGPDELFHNDIFRTSCEKIMKEDMRITSLLDVKIARVQHRSGKLKLQLRGVYMQGQTFYFLLRMQNKSPLDYDVEAIRFFIADPPNTKKVSVSQQPAPVSSVRSSFVQCKELKPVYVYDSSSMARGYGKAVNVVVVPKFTLPYGKCLLIEVLEKNGGRQLQLQANNFMLERAHIL